MFLKTKLHQIDSPEIPHSTLLGVSSSIKERHGELSEVIGNLPIVTCRELGRVTSKVMREYFTEEGISDSVQARVRRLGFGVYSATTATLKTLEDDSLPDVDVSEHFPNVKLMLCDKDGKSVDESVRAIVGRIGLGGYFDHGRDDRTYLFRIATPNPQVNMVTELHRDRFFNTHFDTRHTDIAYRLTFAGYDAL